MAQSFYSGDVMRRICTTWSKADRACPMCGRNAAAVGAIDARPYIMACTDCGQCSEIEV